MCTDVLHNDIPNTVCLFNTCTCTCTCSLEDNFISTKFPKIAKPQKCVSTCCPMSGLQ